MVFRKIFSVAILFVALGTFAGCGGAMDAASLSRAAQLVPVTGLVTLDGAPLEGIVVTYLVGHQSDQGAPATGVTDPQGRYSLSTYISAAAGGELPGAIPGEYRVALMKLIMPDGTSVPADVTDADAEAMKARQLLPAKYSHPGNTVLTATVNAAPTQNDFALGKK